MVLRVGLRGEVSLACVAAFHLTFSMVICQSFRENMNYEFVKLNFITNLQKAAGRVPDSRGQNLVSKQRVDGRRLSIACSPEKSDL